ncbi:MAG TPA: translation elongation factor Ts [Gammaproteobacteria bacterium]|nr:translation elongation factor Ts [Gammaproteobacteria bacterium]
MEITASQVRELRERSGAGMMECKKALVESSGDIEAAAEWLRKNGIAKAVKKSARVAAEGGIVLKQAGNRAVLVEVNSETDFVAKDENFRGFAEAVGDTVLKHKPAGIEKLMALPLEGGAGETVEAARTTLVAKLGENISVRRFEGAETSGGHIGAYLHGARIGVLVDVHGGDEALARDLAMHIAASRPVCVSEEQVPADLVAKEKEIFMAQAADSGKPPNIIEKMVEGKLKKFVSEVSLLGQPFVKDPEITVGKLLAKSGAGVKSFLRMEVGEGIEKKTGDFAAEVMAQAKKVEDPPKDPKDPAKH